jgi:hypothetical protein
MRVNPDSLLECLVEGFVGVLRNICAKKARLKSRISARIHNLSCTVNVRRRGRSDSSGVAAAGAATAFGLPGAHARPHHRCMRGFEPVACRRLSRALASGEANGCASPPAEAVPRPGCRGTSNCAGPLAWAALRRSGPRRDLRLFARRRRLPLLDPHQVPHSGRKPGSPGAASAAAPSGLQKAGAAGEAVGVARHLPIFDGPTVPSGSIGNRCCLWH